MSHSPGTDARPLPGGARRSGLGADDASECGPTLLIRRLSSVMADVNLSQASLRNRCHAAARHVGWRMNLLVQKFGAASCWCVRRDRTHAPCAGLG